MPRRGSSLSSLRAPEGSCGGLPPACPGLPARCAPPPPPVQTGIGRTHRWERGGGPRGKGQGARGSHSNQVRTQGTVRISIALNPLCGNAWGRWCACWRRCRCWRWRHSKRNVHMEVVHMVAFVALRTINNIVLQSGRRGVCVCVWLVARTALGKALPYSEHAAQHPPLPPPRDDPAPWCTSCRCCQCCGGMDGKFNSSSRVPAADATSSYARAACRPGQR